MANKNDLQPSLPAESARLRHALSYLVRQADAAVRIHTGVLLEEVIYNFFGQYSLPLVLLRHGVIGARNREYIGLSRNAVVQTIIFSSILLLNILYIVFHADTDFLFGLFELVFIDAILLLRAITIAIKYSTYSLAEWKELDVRPLSHEELDGKMILFGWTDPPHQLLYAEMERAIVRSCAHLAKHRIVFPDDETRRMMLYQMSESVPSFVKYELCAEVSTDNLQSHDSDTCPTCLDFKRDVAEAFVQHFDTPHEVSPEEGSTSTSASPNPGPVNSDGTLSGSLGGPNEEEASHSLPWLPAKLFLWHVIRSSARGGQAQVQPFKRLSTLFSLMVGLLPIIIRGSFDILPSMSGVGWAANVLYLFLSFMLLDNVVAFVFVGVYDHSRRLYGAKLLRKLLDPNALVALRMHDDAEPVNEGEEGNKTPWYVNTGVRSTFDAASPRLRLRKREYAHMEFFPERDDKDFAQLLSRPSSSDLSSRDILANAQPSRRGVKVTPTTSDTPAVENDSSDARSPTVVIKDGSENQNENKQPLSARSPRPAQNIAVSRRVRERIISKHQLLSAEELRSEVLEESMAHVSIPIFYPQNVLAWSHMRAAVMDLGRSYYYRIMIFTAVFAAAVAASVAFLFIMLARRSDLTPNTSIVLTVTCLAQVALSIAVVGQVLQGSRVNKEAAEHQLCLNKIESLAYEYLATARARLAPAVKERLLEVKKVATSIVEQIMVEDKLHPARVMGVPASVGLLGTFGSVTLSGVLATYQNLAGTK